MTVVGSWGERCGEGRVGRTSGYVNGEGHMRPMGCLEFVTDTWSPAMACGLSTWNFLLFLEFVVRRNCEVKQAKVAVLGKDCVILSIESTYMHTL